MDLDLSKIKKVFFVGIGGIGISAIARMLLQEGKEVIGSDITETEITRELQALGIPILIGQDFELIPKDVGLIVYTLAVEHYDPSLLEKILDCGIPARSYPQMLHIVTAGKYTIAVSGTHGKTTTTAMIAKVLIETKQDPSVIVGSLLKEYKSNLIVGKSDYFVVEACEYERSFLNINPTILVITNIEKEHLDYYKDINDIERAFADLALQTSAVVVCNPNDPAIDAVLSIQNKSKKDLQIVDYMAYLDHVPPLAVPGKHNRLNAACALAVADMLKINMDDAKNAVAQFQGTWRRLEKRGTTSTGTIVYDDYAHHPTEIKASLEALRELYPKGEKKITVLFQPHLYSRTKALFNDFIKSFDEADSVSILPIYFAREEPDPEITSEKLAEAIRVHRGESKDNPFWYTHAFVDMDQAVEYATNLLNLGKDDVFVTMGAGEAYKVGDSLLKKA